MGSESRAARGGGVRAQWLFPCDRVTTTVQVPPLGLAVFGGDVTREPTSCGYGQMSVPRGMGSGKTGWPCGVVSWAAAVYVPC
jgi:hypothetical protein